VRVAGVSCITNLASGIAQHALDHAEVLAVGRQVGGQFRALVREFVARL
jgi:purine-nucleoside phosphorylase